MIKAVFSSIKLISVFTCYLFKCMSGTYTIIVCACMGIKNNYYAECNVIYLSLLKQPSQSYSLLECMIFHQTIFTQALQHIESNSKQFLSQCAIQVIRRAQSSGYDTSVGLKIERYLLLRQECSSRPHTPQYNSFPNEWPAYI